MLEKKDIPPALYTSGLVGETTLPPKQEFLTCHVPGQIEKPDTPRFLIMLDKGIGDAVTTGLGILDQFILNCPEAAGAIDILCNPIQAELFTHDPRINRIIQIRKISSSTPPSQWIYEVKIDDEWSAIARFLRHRHYEAVLPGVIIPGLLLRIGATWMCPNFIELAKDILALRQQGNMHINTLFRKIVNHYFNNDDLPEPSQAPIRLYLDDMHMQKARRVMGQIKEQAIVAGREKKVLVVAPDASSAITRPPTTLLAPALSEALARCPQLVVCILPGYTDTTCAEKLWQTLAPVFPHRVFALAARPQATLLETAALIDQADIFLTGDTGVMHLAVTEKVLPAESNNQVHPRNDTSIIVLFGGTNAGLFGYTEQTMILGRGRKEQYMFRPGFSKDDYDTTGHNFFDHLNPQDVAAAIVQHCM